MSAVIIAIAVATILAGIVIYWIATRREGGVEEW